MNKMAYHDNQDFKSDLNIEVAREADILEAGQDLKDIKCDKNPGHKGFIPFKDLTLEDLPNEERNRETLDKIKKMGSCVVRLVVNKKKLGTGYVFRFDEGYCIQTNNHVVKTDDEVKHCAVEFHYDDESRSSVLTSRGVELLFTCPHRDIAYFSFDPVPDFIYQQDWMDRKLPSTVIMDRSSQIVTKMTYLYTRSPLKYFSYLDLNSSLIDLMFISWTDRSFSYLKSSYFKFHSIPSNIQELTSIEIHIDEDDGNRRVIPGDVVKFGDEFLVKMSESLFQYEVKKCRLLWNGEVIGRGTRLYFEQVKSSDMLMGIDLEYQNEQGIENQWIFECHPIPTFVEDTPQKKQSNNLCCIGHPHGRAKVVTFGRYLAYSRELSKKDVAFLNYSCKTCPGSSGSPVFELYQRGDWSYSLCHFMTKRVEEFLLDGGELRTYMNMAWVPLVHSQSLSTTSY